MKIGIAIATYERPESTMAVFASVYDDPRVWHVAISDDASGAGEYDRLVKHVAHLTPLRHVTCRQNAVNVGSWENKRRAVELSDDGWVALIDSDNSIGPRYLDALEALQPWEEGLLYLPVRGVPALNYAPYEGLLIGKATISYWLLEPSFQMALNTGNFFVHRASHLSVSDGPVEESYASDGIYFVYRWLASGRRVLIAPGLEYQHLVHAGHWTQTAAQSTAFANELIRRMREGIWEASCAA